MGLEQSKIDKQYYDEYFGHNFEKKYRGAQFTDVPDLRGAIYVPKTVALPASPSVVPLPPQSQPILQPKTQSLKKKNKKEKEQKHPLPGKTYFYFEDPEVLYVPTPVQYRVPQRSVIAPPPTFFAPVARPNRRSNIVYSVPPRSSVGYSNRAQSSIIPVMPPVRAY